MLLAMKVAGTRAAVCLSAGSPADACDAPRALPVDSMPHADPAEREVIAGDSVPPLCGLACRGPGDAATASTEGRNAGSRDITFPATGGLAGGG
jgi:hypothetical protein